MDRARDLGMQFGLTLPIHPNAGVASALERIAERLRDIVEAAHAH